MRRFTAVLLLGSVVLAAAPAAAQVGIETRPDPLAPRVGVVRPQRDETRPRDAVFAPRGPVVDHAPAFIMPFAGRYETATGSGLYGLSGWTSPTPQTGPVRNIFREVTGYLAFGVSVTWSGPLAPPKRTMR